MQSSFIAQWLEVATPTPEAATPAAVQTPIHPATIEDPPIIEPGAVETPAAEGKAKPAKVLTLDERQATMKPGFNHHGENTEEHDSALVIEANALELIEDLRGAGCQFWTVEGRPRLYYPPDLAADLRDQTAELIAGRNNVSREFRRAVREECARRVARPKPAVEITYHTGERILIPRDSTPANWVPKF